jgi:hypothetical protein
MQLSPDEIVYWQLGTFKLNATILVTTQPDIPR